MKMNFLTVFSVSLLSLFLSLCNAQQNTTFQVGVILDANSTNGRIGNTSLLLALSDLYSINSNYSTRIVLHPRDSGPQITYAAASALDLLKDVQVDAIIGPQSSTHANFVSGLGNAAHVPVISFTATSPSLGQPPYFFQAAINDAAQVDAIAAIVKYFHWNQIIFVYEDSDYGNGIIPYLSNAFQQVNARVSYRSVIPISANDDFIIEELKNMRNMQTRVFVVHTTTPLASRIFLKAKEAEMMSDGYVWIVTSGIMNLFYSLDNPLIVKSMQGVLGVKPLVPSLPTLNSTTIRWKKKFAEINPGITVPQEINLYGLWAYDTLSALAQAAEKVGFREPSYLQNTSALNSTDIFITGTSRRGPILRAAMLETEFEGLSGNFRLVNGKLEPSSFEILNVNGMGLTKVGIWKPILESSSRRNANTTGFIGDKLGNITWPGGSSNIPKGWEVPLRGKKLKVGVPSKAGFPEFVNTKDATNITGLYIDLFKYVTAELPYVIEYEFIPFEMNNGSGRSYTNLSYQVFNGNFDSAVGDITITADRSEYVDFTLPIEQGGITMTQKNGQNDFFFFVKPLELKLWLTAIALFIFTGLALWILEHRLNSDFRGPVSEHIGLIFYVPFMSLVFSNREKIVSNLGRLVLVVWVFVVLILTAFYTASLSAKFTIIKLDHNTDSEVSKLIRNKEYVACRSGSFVCDFVKSLGFNGSMIKSYETADEFHAAFSNGSITAMFTRTPYSNLFLSTYCNKYVQVGSAYHTEGFAFVFPKGSPLVADVSRAIIKLTNNHNVSTTTKRWIPETCSKYDSSTEPWKNIELKKFKFLFGITAGITGTCLVVFLATYLYENRDFVQRVSSSNATAWSKLRSISMHFDRRDPRSFRGSGEFNASPNRNVHHRCCTCSAEGTPLREM
ncbi:PREDICTED: glutamate receptor 2.7-like isoform X1 [Erythranthe guttata]|uniref:glutamate receptor 2.7-like isoform X1 n=1 Tax=Erythranthe guttata TaxID=4155 RepID=UPI00064D7B3D|nr:PREDICTED: glutamate receptor 2.7-like isoform X1 [Erythranthe guttata]|eukprot:XP_012856516.1 PREDICTED: glutamate receptor 2.7-like isoform X1 [Erythranthe guttata]